MFPFPIVWILVPGLSRIEAGSAYCFRNLHVSNASQVVPEDGVMLGGKTDRILQAPDVVPSPLALQEEMGQLQPGIPEDILD
mgnify:CR=1 FL=1